MCVCDTECDQVIFSGGETSGTVTSPYYPRPYPLNVQCVYYIDGLQDKQNLEKVKLTINDIDIPRNGQRLAVHPHISMSAYTLSGKWTDMIFHNI